MISIRSSSGGDTGTTEPAAATRRYGAEIFGRYRVGNALFADVDATFTHAAFRANAGNGNAIALAPTRTLTAGIAAAPTFGAFTPFSSLRVKAGASRPANDDASLTAEGFTIFNAEACVRWHDIEAGVDVQNVFWREVARGAVRDDIETRL